MNNNQINVNPSQKLYSAKSVGYYTKSIPPQITGSFEVNTKYVTYTPLPFYVMYKPFIISMSDIISVTRTRVMGLNTCITIQTNDKKYLFALGFTANINDVVSKINRHKG